MLIYLFKVTLCFSFDISLYLFVFGGTGGKRGSARQEGRLVSAQDGWHGWPWPPGDPRRESTTHDSRESGDHSTDECVPIEQQVKSTAIASERSRSTRDAESRSEVTGASELELTSGGSIRNKGSEHQSFTVGPVGLEQSHFARLLPSRLVGAGSQPTV